MPVGKNIRCPYKAEWNMVDETKGVIVTKVIGPEDVLLDLSNGLGTYEIIKKHKAPQSAVEHVVSMIPFMLDWRDSVMPPEDNENGDEENNLDLSNISPDGEFLDDNQLVTFSPEGQLPHPKGWGLKE